MGSYLTFALVGLLSLHGTLATRCNGDERLCKLRLDEVTFPGTHNSGANRIMKYNLKISMAPALSCFYRNQDLTFAGQLDFGIRFFDIDTCLKGGKAWTCHSDAYGQPLSEVIREVANWMNQPSHRNEVIVIRFHDTSIDGIGLFDPLLRQYFSGNNGQVGVNDDGSWPTLGDAVAKNRRVFIFMNDRLCSWPCRRQHEYVRSSHKYGDTWIERKLTSSCAGMVQDTRNKCQHMHKSLSIVSAFASIGLCVDDLQGVCNPQIRGSAMACFEERKKRGKTVNFLIADYVNQAKTSQNVVTVSRELNELNLKMRGYK